MCIHCDAKTLVCTRGQGREGRQIKEEDVRTMSTCGRLLTIAVAIVLVLGCVVVDRVLR